MRETRTRIKGKKYADKFYRPYPRLRGDNKSEKCGDDKSEKRRITKEGKAHPQKFTIFAGADAGMRQNKKIRRVTDFNLWWVR